MKVSTTTNTFIPTSMTISMSIATNMAHKSIATCTITITNIPMLLNTNMIMSIMVMMPAMDMSIRQIALFPMNTGIKTMIKRITTTNIHK